MTKYGQVQKWKLNFNFNIDIPLTRRLIIFIYDVYVYDKESWRGIFMSINILDITWEELELLDKNKSVVFIYFSPIEQHGRHLPLGVDIFQAEYWGKGVIELLELHYKDYKFINTPCIPFGYGVDYSFPGNMYLDKQLMETVVYKTIENITKWGIKNIVIIAGHADPINLICIEKACDKINQMFGVCAFSPMGSIFSGIRPKKIKDDELLKLFNEYPNDFHAGWIETSNILNIKNELVNDKYNYIKDICVEKEKMMDCKIYEQTRGEGHFGYPRIAKACIGEKLNKDIINNIFETVKAFIKRDNYEIFMHHILYNRTII